MRPSSDEPWRLGALELAGAITSRRLSTREVIEAHLRRIEQVDPVVNAVPEVLGERALDAADAADRALARGAEPGPLHGVPFTVKANIDLVGSPTTHGSKTLAGAYPFRTSPDIERLLAAGAIPIGRTNLPTFAIRWHTDSELWGPTLNPWDPSLTPGASSGGDAVAVATGMSPLGVGNDTLGSLRWPAQCCGIAALKPTLGRIPAATSIGPPDAAIGTQLTTVDGPLARRVRDLRSALGIMAGVSPRDPWSVPVPLVGPPVDPVTVAVVPRPGGLETAPQVLTGVRKAAAMLEDAGYGVVEAEPPSVREASRALLHMLATPEMRHLWTTAGPNMPPGTRRFMASFFQVAGDPDPVVALGAFMTRASVLRAWGEFQETHPLILAPVSTGLPFRAGADVSVEQVAQIIEDMRMAMAVSALGLPAVAVPVGVQDGLPQVVQVIGPRYREDLCLDAAEALERRCGILTPIDPVARPPAVSRPGGIGTAGGTP